MNTSQNEPIDFESLFDRCLRDPAFFEELLTIFAEQSKRQITSIRSAIEARESEALWGGAHSLKGSAANLSAGVLNDLKHIGFSSPIPEFPALFSIEYFRRNLHNKVATCFVIAVHRNLNLLAYLITLSLHFSGGQSLHHFRGTTAVLKTLS